MKFNPTKLIVEEDSGAAGGYMGYASDADVYVQTPYDGIAHPRNSTGSFGTVFQNKSGFKPMKSLDQTQLNHVRAAIMSYLSGTFADPRQALYNLKVKLNHLGLDFTFNRNVPLNPGPVSFQLSRFGEKFGTTPTTDLSKGFDRGQDYTNISLNLNIEPDPSGQYSFTNISIGNTSGESMQIENFYQQLASNEYLYENVFKPIALNLMEKYDEDTLTDKTIMEQLGFVVQRSATKMGIELNEQETIELVKGLYTMIFEEEKKKIPQIPVRGDNLSSSRTNMSKERRKAMFKRIREQQAAREKEREQEREQK